MDMMVCLFWKNNYPPLAEIYSDSDIRRMIIDKGGVLYGDIISARR
jgi:hypothetical protein